MQAQAVVTRRQMGGQVAVLKETVPKYMICELNTANGRSMQQVRFTSRRTVAAVPQDARLPRCRTEKEDAF